MSDYTTPPPDSTIDLDAYLGLTRNPDGSVSHRPDLETPATLDPDSSYPVLTIDFPINQSNNTWLRLFIPRQPPADNSPTTKLPLIVFYHGGGFLKHSPASTLFHNFCTTLAIGIPAVIASVTYRLAPEHRLPTAYDDAVEALHWIKTTKEECYTKYVDMSNCYVMGNSAGANIAYHACLRAAPSLDHFLSPLKIKGLILHQPFFGGTVRTQSELRLVNDKALPLQVNDMMWELALPVGVDRDHEYCNPMANSGSEKLCKKIKIFVLGWEGDPLIDRQVEFVKMLEKEGVKVVSKFGRGGYHGYEIKEPSKAEELALLLKEFVSTQTTGCCIVL